MSFRYISERAFQRSLINWSIYIHLIQGILIREAVVIRHLEDLVTLQFVYKRGTFAAKIGIKNVSGLPCYRIFIYLLLSTLYYVNF